MITASGRNFVAWAMQDLGVLAAGEVPSPGEADDGLASLNLLADALGIERLLLYAVVRTTKALGSGTASYTIGAGGSIDIARPLWIARAGLVLDSTASQPIEVPIDVLDQDGYADWSQKGMTGQPSAIFYDHGFNAVADTDRGTVYVLPIPTAAVHQLVLYTPGGEVSQFAEIDTEYTFPKGYGRLIRKLLAVELKPMYPAATLDPVLVRQANHARRVIKTANIRPGRRVNRSSLQGRGHFDFHSGRFR